MSISSLPTSSILRKDGKPSEVRSEHTADNKHHKCRFSFPVVKRIRKKLGALLGCLPSTQKGIPCEAQASERGVGGPHFETDSDVPVRKWYGKHSETRRLHSEATRKAQLPTSSGSKPKCPKKKPRKLTFRHRRLWFHSTNNEQQFRDQDPLPCSPDDARLFIETGGAPQGERDFSTTKTCGSGTEQGADTTARSDEGKTRSEAGDVCGDAANLAAKEFSTGQAQDHFEPKAPKNVQFVSWWPSTQTIPEAPPERDDTSTSRILYGHTVDCNILRGSSSKDTCFGLAAKERICIHNFYVSRQGDESRIERLCACYNMASKAIHRKTSNERASDHESMKCSENENMISALPSDKDVQNSENEAQFCREELPTERCASAARITVNVDPDMKLQTSSFRHSAVVHDLLEDLIARVVEKALHTNGLLLIEKRLPSGVGEPLTWESEQSDHGSFAKNPTGSSILESHDLTKSGNSPSAMDGCHDISTPDKSSGTLSNETKVTKITKLTRMSSLTESYARSFLEPSMTDSDPMTYSGSQFDPRLNALTLERFVDENGSDAAAQDMIADHEGSRNAENNQREERNAVYEWMVWLGDLLNTRWSVF